MRPLGYGFIYLFFVLLSAGNLGAAESPRLILGGQHSLHGGNPEFAKAAVDTYRLLGPWNSGADYNGQFEDVGAGPAWNCRPLFAARDEPEEQRGRLRLLQPDRPPRRIATTPRIGIRQAVDFPYRFVDPDSSCLSP